MKIKLYMKLEKKGKFVGKDSEKNVFLLQNEKGEVIEVSQMIFKLWEISGNNKTVREVINEYMKFYRLRGWELRRIVKEILEMFVEKSLLSIQA